MLRWTLEHTQRGLSWIATRDECACKWSRAIVDEKVLQQDEDALVLNVVTYLDYKASSGGLAAWAVIEPATAYFLTLNVAEAGIARVVFSTKNIKTAMAADEALCLECRGKPRCQSYPVGFIAAATDRQSTARQLAYFAG